MRWIIIVLLTLFLSACSSDILFFDKQEIPAYGWTSNAQKVFTFSISDTTLLYDMLLDINHRSDFGYENLYTTLQTRYPDGKQVIDTVSFQLSNKYGEWIGDCSGDNCKIPIQLQQSIRFPNKGAYELSIDQHSRRDTLQGISGLDLSVSLSETH